MDDLSLRTLRAETEEGTNFMIFLISINGVPAEDGPKAIKPASPVLLSRRWSVRINGDLGVNSANYLLQIGNSKGRKFKILGRNQVRSVN